MSDILNEKKRLIWLCNKILNKKLDTNNFDEKLAVQKAIYLSKQMGMNFRYNFGWHVRGVYSSALTVDMYTTKNDICGYTPSPEEETIVNQLLSIKDKNDFGNISRTLELISSVVYAQNTLRIRKEGIIKFIKTEKPWYDDVEIEKAISLIKSLLHKNSV